MHIYLSTDMMLLMRFANAHEGINFQSVFYSLITSKFKHSRTADDMTTRKMHLYLSLLPFQSLPLFLRKLSMWLICTCRHDPVIMSFADANSRKHIRNNEQKGWTGIFEKSFGGLVQVAPFWSGGV